MCYLSLQFNEEGDDCRELHEAKHAHHDGNPARIHLDGPQGRPFGCGVV